MTTAVDCKGISGRNRSRLSALHRGLSGPFSVQEAADALGFDLPETHRFLSYLTRRGWLVRHKRGYYGLVPLEADQPISWVEDPWVVATKVYGPDGHVGGFSACEHWEFTDQIFRDTIIITSTPPRQRKEVVGGFTFRLNTRRPESIFGVSSLSNGSNLYSVSDPTKTLVDILDDPTLGGGIRHVGEVVYGYFDSDHTDEDLLVEYAQRLGNRTVFKRLGYLTEVFNVGTPELQERCRNGMSAGMSLLDPGLPARGRFTRKWNLRVNSDVAPNPYF